MEKKKIFIVLGIILIVILSIFLINKLVILNKYSDKSLDNNFKTISDNYKIKETITINTNPVSDYIQLDEIKIRDDFSNYEKDFVASLIEKTSRYTNSENNSYFSMGVSQNYLDYYNAESLIYEEDKDSYLDRINYLKQNNITNDIELVKFIGENNYKRNIFTSNKTIRGIYSTYLMASIFNFKNVTSINGSYNGFMYESFDNVREVNLYKNNKRYVFMFVGADFPKEKVIDLLNTIIID